MVNFIVEKTEELNMNYRLISFCLTLCVCFSHAAVAMSPKAPQKLNPRDSMAQECPDTKYSDIFSPGDSLDSSRQKVEARLLKIGLKVSWGINLQAVYGTWDSFSDNSADIANLKRISNIIVPALEKYPNGWFAKLGVETIAIVKNLQVASTFRNAMPDPSDKLMFYSYQDNMSCDPGLEERFQHEIYHYVEWKFHGDMYYHDPAWMQLNSKDFQYGTGGISDYGKPGWQNLGHQDPGFTSLYSESAAEEDKAEMFGWMMTEIYATRVKTWSNSDAILQKKRKFLVDFFQAASDIPLSESFFENISH